MDRISHLYDELLLRILSLLPAKDVVETMVLSKRWQFLWTFVPKLLYDESYKSPKPGKFSEFVERSLVLHKAPVIETLHFKLGQTSGTGDITNVWFKALNKRRVDELIIETSSNRTPVSLPISLLYTCFGMLVTLKLSRAVLVSYDVNSPISFPSLKKLSLKSVQFIGDELFNKILSSSPVLEDLAVEQSRYDNVPVMSVRVPSLKRLQLHRFDYKDKNNSEHGFVIDAPSLESLDIYHSCGFCIIESNMTKIVSANLVVMYWRPSMKLTCLTSAKHLYLCIPTSKEAYPVGSIFSNVVHLKICTCETEWVNLFMRVLRDFPNLKALKLSQCHYLRDEEPRPCWIELEPNTSVPECLVSSLETFEWVNYDGAKEEKEVAAYILRSASCLKKATIIPSKKIDSDKKLEMNKELSLSARRSAACQLSFS